MKNRFSVVLAKLAEKQLRKVPPHVRIKLQAWVDDIEHRGLYQVRETKGWHDEPLKGDRLGQRSIRLTRAYRAIYEIEVDGSTNIIEIQEVTKHDY